MGNRKLVDFAPGTTCLGEEIIPQRDQEKAHFEEGFKEMANLLTPNRCISRYLKSCRSQQNQIACVGAVIAVRPKNVPPALL